MSGIRNSGARFNVPKCLFLVASWIAAWMSLASSSYAQQPPGSLYGLSTTQSQAGFTWTLYRRDINTGVDTAITVLASGPFNGSYFTGFDPVGRFFTYLVDSSGSPAVTRLYTVNVATGATTSVVVNPLLQNSLYDPVSGAIYGTVIIANTWTLFRRDVTTGVDTPVASIASGNLSLTGSGVGFDPVGRRFFIFLFDNSNPSFRLYTVNVATGATSSNSVTSPIGTVFDAATNSLYDIASPGGPNQPPLLLYRFDLNTLLQTTVVGIGNVGNPTVSQPAFDLVTRRLYYNLDDGSVSPRLQQLYSISLATGATTSVPVSRWMPLPQFGPTIAGPVPAAPVVPAPSLGVVGLLFTAGALVLVAFRVLTRPAHSHL